MSTTLHKHPLRTSLSMVEGHELPEDALAAAPESQPFGYVYSTWDADLVDAEAEPGYYDEQAQVWVDPSGVTMGTATYTRTRCKDGSYCDRTQDDACF